MKWNCYINIRHAGRSTGESLKRILDIPRTSRGDNSYATAYASKKLGFPMDDILCIPTPQSELRGRSTQHRRSR